MRKLFASPEAPKEQRTSFKLRPTSLKYLPLQSSKIRLLRLHPSSGHGFSKILSGSLEVIRLPDGDNSTSKSFEALSYAWGPEDLFREMSLDNTKVTITPNLENALRELRQAKGDRLLWVDAVCIDQANYNEQSEQVRMMSSIYRQADRVIIWMGLNWTGQRGDAGHAIKNFARLQRRGASSDQLLTYLDNPEGKAEVIWEATFFNDRPIGRERVDLAGGHWPVLVDFFDRSWWRRVWVRQELAMSKRAVVQCGSVVIDWSDVAAISHWLKVWVTDLDERSKKWCVRRENADIENNRSSAYSGEDLEYFRQTMNIKSMIRFETMLIHARNCECSNPRDKLYSILGLTGEATSDIVIDYHLPVREVAIQAFQKQVSRSDSLEALVWSQNPGRQDSIPSWAPNLYSTFSNQPSRLKGENSSIYNASASLLREKRFKFLEDKVTLSVEGGLIFDSVHHVSPISSRLNRVTGSQVDRFVSTWKPLVFEWLGTMDIEQKYERFMSAMTFGRDIRNRQLPKGFGGIDWGTYFRVDHVYAKARTEFEYLALAIRRSSFEGTTNQTEINDWLKLCAESIGGRRVILTSEGRIGLVPAEPQQWDLICLLGLDVPFVLRKIDPDTYIVIGEAYIHGAMNGEIMNASVPLSTPQGQEIKLQ